VSFGEAVKYCWKNMFVFTGRARRSEFWWYYLFLSIISLVVGIVFSVILFAAMIPLFAGSDAYGNVDEGALIASLTGMFVAYGVLWLFSIGLLVMMLGASARRLHDMGQSGHWLWLNVVGLGIVPLIMCIMDGQPYENQWGPDPKAAERARMAGSFASGQTIATPPPAPPAPGTTGDPFASPPGA
jgi:uncharacterized membrane protein YhaH (DUF805 family)